MNDNIRHWEEVGNQLYSDEAIWSYVVQIATSLPLRST